MHPKEIQKRLRELVDYAISEGWTSQKLRRELNKLFNKQVYNGLSDSMLKEAEKEFEWLTSRTMNKTLTKYTATVLKTTGKEFARAGNRINRRVLKTVIDGIEKGQGSKDIKKATERIIGTFGHYADAITRTALSGFDAAKNVADMQEAGVKKLKLIGPPAERSWCKGHLGKSYTIAEIEKMSNGQGLPVLLYKGGFRCKHDWVDGE
jgi:hypothetical protein